MKSLMHTMFCTIAITAKMVVTCVLILLFFSCLKALGWDIAALLIVGGIVLIFSFYVVVCNWIMLVSSLTTHRFHSVIPLIGSASGVIGLLLIPVSMPHYLFYLLPVLLDWGTIVFFLSLPHLIIDMFFIPYAVKLEDGFLLFVRKGVTFQKIPVSEICDCEKSGGKVEVWRGNYSICSFGTKWENANEVYAMLKKIGNSNSKHTIATPGNGGICYNIH